MDSVVDLKEVSTQGLYNPRNYAKLSELAYKSSVEDSEVPQGYKLDRELSDANRKTFVSDLGDVVVANAGTQLKKGRRKALADIGSDLALAFGLESKDKRFKQALDHNQRVKEKYCKDGSCVTQTGHSLGGSVSNYVARKGGAKEAITFNQGYGLGSKSAKNSRNYYASGDVISNVGIFGEGENVVKKGGRNKHALRNFT
jgi:hypothetical protein